MENLFSMSIDFSAVMNWDSVEDNLSLVEAGPTDVEMMKVWVNKTLHLIPDLDVTGLSDSDSTTPMSAGTEYTLTVATGAEDSFGNATTIDTSGAITLRPDNGWYVNSSDVLLYAGRADDNWQWSTYDLTSATVPDNFELIFDAKNLAWDGIELMLFDISGSEHNRTAFRMGLNSWSWLDYLDSTPSWSYVSGQTVNIFNGGWKTYRVRLFGNEFSVESKASSANDSEYVVSTTVTVDDIATRTGTDNRLMFRVLQPIGLDNIVLNTLDVSGNETAADTFVEDFTGYTVSGSTFESDLTDTYNDIY
jgi:hypothetical protein